MAGITQIGVLALQPQEPVNVPVPPEGSYYMFVNIYDGITYYKDWNRVCTPISNLTTMTPPVYADDTAAGLAGLTKGRVYQTDGTAAIPLNVPGIVMIKQ